MLITHIGRIMYGDNVCSRLCVYVALQYDLLRCKLITVLLRNSHMIVDSHKVLGKFVTHVNRTFW